MLEPRIMFDGAAVYAASETVKAVEDKAQNNSPNEIDTSLKFWSPSLDNETVKAVEDKAQNNSPNEIDTSLKFWSPSLHNDSRKEIVFIDKGVYDYQTIINSIDDTKSIYLIDPNENGFVKMQSILGEKSDIDAVHIIGHASTGQVVLGNSILNSETINSFSSTLQSIGTSLTQDGDLLFYGCNLAQGDQGKLLIQQIGNITQADIAASDDSTGIDGDWLLEVEKGIIEAKSLEINHYGTNLVTLAGVSSSSGFVVETGTNLRAGQNAANTASNASNHTDGVKPYVVALERENLTSGTFEFYKQDITGYFEESNSGVDTNGPDISSNTTSVTATQDDPLNVYLVMATENSGRNTVRSITFDGEIKGIWFNMENIIEYAAVDKDNATYHTISQHGNSNRNAFSTEKLRTNWGTDITINSKPDLSGGQKYKNDWFGVDTDSNTLYVGFNNSGKHGDTIRVFTANSNSVTAVNDTDAVNENASVTKTGSQDDVLNDDSDPESDTFDVSHIKKYGGTNSTVADSSTYSSNFTSVTGVYGTLKIGADGSYIYSADQSAADDLDAGDQVTDTFVYTITDEHGATDTANLVFTVTGINDAPVAVNDTDSVTADQSVSKSASQDDVMNDDYDPDDDDTFTVTHIKKSGAASNSTVSSSTTNANGTSVTGTYGVLTIGADGSYTYNANNADSLADGIEGTDTFVYTITDTQGGTATANLVITVTGINNAPTAQNDVGVIDEGETLTVANGTNANVSGSFDADEEHSGDLMDTSSSSHEDSDSDGDTLSITLIKETTAGSNSSVSSNSTYNGTGSNAGTSVSGLYGTLTIGSDGSYKYVANDSISGFDDGETLTDSFTYTLSDGTATDTATLSITLLGQDNESPSATNNTNSVDEDSSVSASDGSTGTTGDVLTNDTDPEGDTLSVSKIKKNSGNFSNVSSGTTNSNGTSVTGTYGTLVIGADGSYTYTADQSAADDLDKDDTENDIFVYEVSDGNGGTAQANITITVTGINDTPDAVDDTDTVNENETVTKTGSQDDVLNDDSDPDDDDTFTVTKIKHSSTTNSDVNASSTYNSNFTTVTGTFGTLKIGADGSYVYAADQTAANALDSGETGTDTFTYTIKDSNNAEDTATLTITVNGANDTPVAVDDTDSTNEGQSVTKTGSQNDVLNDDSDPDGDTITVTQIKKSGGSNSAVSASSTYNSNGTSVDGDKGTLVIGADGSYTYTANSDISGLDDGATTTDTFVYTISDGDATHTAELVITITGGSSANRDPSATNNTNSVNEDGSVTASDGSTGTTGDVLTNDSDPDGDSISVSKIKKNGGSYSNISSGTNNSNGTSVTGTYGTLVIGADGSYTYTADQFAADDLDASEQVTDVFVYEVSDGNGGTAEANITITVTGVNDDPDAVNDTDSVNEDASVSKSGTGDDVINDDSDPDDDDTLTVTQIKHSSGTNSDVSSGTNNSNGTSVTGTYGTLVIGADGSYTYTADQSAADDLDLNETATDTFVYTITDSQGGTDTANLVITVTGVNDDPVAVNDTDSVNEDATVTKTSSQDDVMNDDSDPDDDDSFTVTQIKKNNGSNSNVASGSTYNTNGTSVTGEYGTLVIGADGSYTYTADQTAADNLDKDQTATDTFVYTITDSNNATATANLVITITGVNDDPVGVDDTDSVNEDATVFKKPSEDDVLNDDTDLDTSSSLTVTNISHSNGNSGSVNSGTTYDGTGSQAGTTIVGTYGTLTIGADGSYTYTADQDAADDIADGSSETDVFTYTVSDGTATDTATITITVNGVNNEVSGTDDTGSVTDGNTLSMGNKGSGLLSNDTDSGSDADESANAIVSAVRTGTEAGTGTSGTVGSSLTGTYGTLTLESDGTYTYVADQDAANILTPDTTAIDYFTYTISNGTSTDTAQLAVTVTGINDAPTSSTAPTFRGAENNRIVIQSKLFFDDPDPSTSTYGQLTYSFGGLPSGLTVNDSGKIKGRLPEGTYTFTVTATDGGNLSTQQTFTIVIGRSGNPGEAPAQPLIIKQKTLEKAIADKTVTFQTPKVKDQIADLAVRGNLSSLVRQYTLNGGMKVIDVAVEDLNIDESGRPGINENTLLGFSIGDDYRTNVKQYTGALDDGSTLPNWIRVDPSTGQTIVQFPQNVYSIDVKVIAIDNDNTTREINLTLDRNSVSKDNALKRDLEPFIDRSAALKTEVTVDEKGQIYIDTQDDIENESIVSDTLNPNDSNNNENQTPNTNDQSSLNDIPYILEEIDDISSQDTVDLNTQNLETDKKLIKFSTLQEQLDSQFEDHENYGDKLVKATS